MMALRQWGLIRKLDKELLQGRVDSKVLIDARRLLTNFVVKRAGQRMEQKRFKESLSDLATARRIYPQSVSVNSALKKLAVAAPTDVASEVKKLLDTAPGVAQGN
jgi:hypothetical protein